MTLKSAEKLNRCTVTWLPGYFSASCNAQTTLDTLQRTA